MKNYTAMPPLVASMFTASIESAAALRERISDVKYGGFNNSSETIKFKLDGVDYLGFLRGRNRDLCIGFGNEADRAIAARVFLDGDAKLKML